MRVGENMPLIRGAVFRQAFFEHVRSIHVHAQDTHINVDTRQFFLWDLLEPERRFIETPVK